VSFEVRGMPHQLVAAILAAEGGIGVRTGLFCSHPYMLEIMDYRATRIAGLKTELASGVRANLPGFIRVSFGIYNSPSEVDTLLAVLEGVASERYAGEYAQDPASGVFHAAGYVPSVEDAFILGR
jgi:cysteine desulfurase/selenocysteine lyase